jgi:glutathione synthase
MSLRVAVQMDPLESINIAGDSTFAIMLGAQKRGHRLFHYLAEDLTLENGRVYAGAHPVTVQASQGDHHQFEEWTILDLGRDVDVVLMRQDPPFDLGYITATHLLERIQAETLVVNDPASVRNAPEKVWVLDFAHFMPPTMITRSVTAARNFLEEHGEIVVKPLHGNGGKAIFRIFVGIDVIGGEWLTEINVTSPTGIVAIDRFNGTDTPALIWDAIEAKLS